MCLWEHTSLRFDAKSQLPETHTAMIWSVIMCLKWKQVRAAGSRFYSRDPGKSWCIHSSRINWLQFKRHTHCYMRYFITTPLRLLCWKKNSWQTFYIYLKLIKLIKSERCTVIITVCVSRERILQMYSTRALFEMKFSTDESVVYAPIFHRRPNRVSSIENLWKDCGSSLISQDYGHIWDIPTEINKRILILNGNSLMTIIEYHLLIAQKFYFYPND